MLGTWQLVVQSIHATPLQCVIVVTGGGSSAIADLLVVPGGSRTVLEAVVPYSSAALTEWLGQRPEQFCSAETALAMAAVAYERSCRLAAAQLTSEDQTAITAGEAPPIPAVMGISCTASLASDRPKKGDHRCHIAVQTAGTTLSATLVLEKGARVRSGEEDLVGQLILGYLAHLASIGPLPLLKLSTTESVNEQRIDAAPSLVELRHGRLPVVWSIPRRLNASEMPRTGSMEDLLTSVDHFAPEFARPAGVLCGAFNPLHFGHQELRAAAEQQLGGPVYYEMSLRNVDKPPLDFLTIDRRRAQFTEHPLALTCAPTFAEKALALPGVTFVVGVDTAEKIVAPRYYHDSEQAMLTALEKIREQGCRFLVAGRKADEKFVTLGDVSLPADYADLFTEIPANAFRADVSSTELRRHGAE